MPFALFACIQQHLTARLPACFRWLCPKAIMAHYAFAKVEDYFFGTDSDPAATSTHIVCVSSFFGRGFHLQSALLVDT